MGLKDLTVMSRDVPALAVLLAMPIVLILILGSALGSMTGGGSGGTLVKVAIVNEDAGTLGARVSDAFTKEERLRKLFSVTTTLPPEAARAGVERGDLAALLVIPRDLSAKLEAGAPVEMKLYTDPGQELSASVFRSVVRSVGTRVSAASVVAQTTAGALRASNMLSDAKTFERYVREAADAAEADGALERVAVQEQAAGTASGEFKALDYYAAGMSVMFLMFGAMYGAFSMVGERVEWTLPRLLTTPTRRWQVVGGKMFGVFVLGMAQFGVLVAFTTALGVRWGDPLGTLLVGAGVVLAVTGLTVLISSLAKSRRAVGGIGPVMVQVQAALGGSFFPIAILPKWIQPVHYLTVTGCGLDGFRALQSGASASAVLPNVAALAGMALLFFVIGAARLRYE